MQYIALLLWRRIVESERAFSNDGINVRVLKQLA